MTLEAVILLWGGACTPTHTLPEPLVAQDLANDALEALRSGR